MTLPEAIQKLRGNQTQKDFAATFGVDSQSVSRYERGFPPAFGILWRMARYAQRVGDAELADVFAAAAAEGVGLPVDELNLGIRPLQNGGMSSILSNGDVDPEFWNRLRQFIAHPQNPYEASVVKFLRDLVFGLK